MGEIKTVVASTAKYILDEDERRLAFEIWQRSEGKGNYFHTDGKIVYDLDETPPFTIEVCEVPEPNPPMGQLILSAYRSSYSYFEARWADKSASLRDLESRLYREMLREYLVLTDEAIAQ